MNKKLLYTKCKKLKKRMEEVFKNLGFSSINVNGIEYFVYNNCFCKLTFLNKLSAFVIESASSYQDIQKGNIEDGDLYYIDGSEDNILLQLQNDLINYYIN